jgi:hypothetical protein
LIINGSVRMGARLSLFGYYTLNYANSDVFGTAASSSSGSTATLPPFPSNPYDLQQDYGRASFDIRNRVFLGGTVGLPRGFRLSPFMVASSGPPFNITTGADPYQDSVYNTRPAFGTCPPDKLTAFGCFNSVPGVGYVPIPPFYGEGPSRFALNLRFSKTFGFGPVLEMHRARYKPAGWAAVHLAADQEGRDVADLSEVAAWMRAQRTGSIR